MSSQLTNEVVENQEQQVVEYLRKHPNFFDVHTELLSGLRLSHRQSGNSVSLIERQVKVLREQNRELKNHLQELISIARDNDDLSQRLNSLIIALLAVKNRAELVSLLEERLHKDFAADVISLHFREADIEPDWQELYDAVAIESVKCGHTAEQNKQLLFGEMAEGIDSLALISLGEHGLLAIGSHDREHFHTALATDYLKQLAAVIKVTLTHLN